jgi:hypothetical protein
LVATTEKSNGSHAHHVITGIHADESAFELLDLRPDLPTQCDSTSIGDVERDH